MTARHITLADWIASVLKDQHERMDRLAIDARDLGSNSGTVYAHEFLGEARDAWCRGAVAEVERLIGEATSLLAREREWLAEHRARYPASRP